MRWKRRSSPQYHGGSNCLGGQKVELPRQRRHDRDQSSHAQEADFGGQLVQGVMHPTLLVLGTCRQSTGQRALTWSSHDPGQPPEPRTGGEYLAGLSRCDQESFCRTLLLGQYG